MIIIGVTGGMASGKTTLAKAIAGRDMLHLDADALVHKLMHNDRRTIDAIAERFPSALKDKRISRAELSKLLVKDKKVIDQLEKILHPRVREEEERLIKLAKRQRRKGVVLDIPLLFESGANKLCDIVIVAHAPEEVRKRRAFKRKGMTEEKWLRLVIRQLTEHERCERADVVVPTTRGLVAMRRAARAIRRHIG